MSEWFRHLFPPIVVAAIAYLLSRWLKGWLSKSEDTVYNVSLSSGQKEEISIARQAGTNPDAAVQMVLLKTISKMRNQERTPETIKEVERLAQELERQRQTSPMSRRINILLGNVYRYLGRLSDAIALMLTFINYKLQAEQRDHDLADALYNRACYLALTGDSVSAISDLRESFLLDPENRESASRDPDLQSVMSGFDNVKPSEAKATGNFAVANLDALRRKYASVIESLQRFAPYGATLDAVDLDGEKLLIKGTVPSRVVLERVWDQIKKADPTYSDLHHEIAIVGGDTQPVTIKSGDTLSAISLLFYGNANKYPQIAKANNIADPNKVPVGTTLELPVITP